MRQFLFLLSFLVFGQIAKADPVDAGNSVAELIAERSSIAPGDSFLAGFKLDIDEGWHVYWRNAGDAGIAPSIEWNVTNGAETGEFIWPAPHTIPLETLMNYGYEDQVVLPFEVTVPDTFEAGDLLVMSGFAEWQICLDVCIWESAELDLILPVSDTPVIDEENAGLIAKALEASPKDLTGKATTSFVGEDTLRLSIQDAALAEVLPKAKKVRFFPYDQEIEHFPAQALRTGDQGGTLDLTLSSLYPKKAMPIAGIVAAEFNDHSQTAFRVDALIGDVLPGTDDYAHKTAVETVTAGLGQIAIWLGFAFLGGLILNLMPCVLPVLTIKANGLLHATHKGDQSLREHGLGYLAGVLTCFLAIGIVLLMLRSAGEQVGLGFQLQYPPMVLGLALLMFIVGLNLLGVFEIGASVMGAGSSLAAKEGVVGAYFTGLLAAIVGAPCVGPLLAASLGAVVSQPVWVVLLFLAVMGAGLAAPFVLLSFIPGLAKSMPKPGPWMDTLKQVLAFPLFLTAVWLLWVFAAQKGADATLIVIAAAVVLGFGIWMLTHPRASKIAKSVGGLILVTSLIAPFILTAGASSYEMAAMDAKGENAYGVETGSWSPDKVAELRAAGKPVFIDFTARWCVTCQVNKRVALNTESVQRAFSEQGVVFLTADWTNRNEMIATELAKHKRAGVPLYLYYPADGEVEVLPQLLTPGLVVNTISKGVL